MFTVEYYLNSDGTNLVAEWLAGLSDPQTFSRFADRIDRLELGNFGDHKPVGEGVWELRLNFGPGYRVYYVRVGSAVLLLLGGGTKASQKRDIRRAIRNKIEQEGRDE